MKTSRQRRSRVQIIAVFVLLFSLPTIAGIEELEGAFLYKVTTIRAASGALADLLKWEAEMRASRKWGQTPFSSLLYEMKRTVKYVSAETSLPNVGS